MGCMLQSWRGSWRMPGDELSSQPGAVPLSQLPWVLEAPCGPVEGRALCSEHEAMGRIWLNSAE